jgi:hypothetical protein
MTGASPKISPHLIGREKAMWIRSRNDSFVFSAKFKAHSMKRTLASNLSW